MDNGPIYTGPLSTYGQISVVDGQAEAILVLEERGRLTTPVPHEVRVALENLRNVIALTGADKPQGSILDLPPR